MERIVKTACQGCHSECGVLVHVTDGKVTKIEGDPDHPFTRGFICIKGRVHSEFLYHPDRLKYPMKRAGEKAGGKWVRVSWEEALGDIADRLTRVKEKYGPESIAVFHGTGPRPSIYVARLLAKALGTPNTVSTDLHICAVPGFVAEIFTYGRSVLVERGPDYLSSKCVMAIGGNPLVSHPPRGMDILEAKRKNKAKLIVVDPRRTELASKADLWLQVRPGTDVALALGMVNTVIKEKLYDKEFVDKYCFGFDKLSERAEEYPPERVAEITWVPADKIREAARLYATIKPAVLHHRVAIDNNINSTQTTRALAILAALAGNLDVKGGNLWPNDLPGYVSIDAFFSGSMGRPSPEVEKKRIGASQYPFISGPEAPVLPFVHANLSIEAILTGKPYPLKGAYCVGGNPVVNMQNVKRVWQAVKSLDLFVVADFFMTPTAELADYVLPVTTWLERDECCDRQYMNCISVRQKAVEPLFECRDDLQVSAELVKKLPWADQRIIPWNNLTELSEFRLKGLGMTFEDFKKRAYVPVPEVYKRYEKQGFQTPTGKVELYSTTFEKYGYDPLPSFKEPPQSPLSTPELLKEYPLILITGARYIEYYHSMGRQIPSLRKRVPDPQIEINPDTAKRLGLKEGDWVWVETPMARGERARFKVTLTPGIDPRVVNTAHAWWFPEKPAPEHGCFESNISALLSDAPPREAICGSVPTRGTLCRVYKVGKLKN